MLDFIVPCGSADGSAKTFLYKVEGTDDHHAAGKEIYNMLVEEGFSVACVAYVHGDHTVEELSAMKDIRTPGAVYEMMVWD